jgi:putative endonuclease
MTSHSVEARLENHIKKKYSQRNYTQKAQDWRIYLRIECSSYSQARKIEIHLKKMKSKKYFEHLKTYPEIGEKLLRRYKSF